MNAQTIIREMVQISDATNNHEISETEEQRLSERYAKLEGLLAEYCEDQTEVDDRLVQAGLC